MASIIPINHPAVATLSFGGITIGPSEIFLLTNSLV